MMDLTMPSDRLHSTVLGVCQVSSGDDAHGCRGDEKLTTLPTETGVIARAEHRCARSIGALAAAAQLSVKGVDACGSERATASSSSLRSSFGGRGVRARGISFMGMLQTRPVKVTGTCKSFVREATSIGTWRVTVRPGQPAKENRSEISFCNKV